MVGKKTKAKEISHISARSPRNGEKMETFAEVYISNISSEKKKTDSKKFASVSSRASENNCTANVLRI